MKDERYEQFEQDCQSLIGNVTDALFVAWGRGVLAGRAEEKKNNTIDAGDAYQRGYTDGMKEAVRTAERMVKE